MKFMKIGSRPDTFYTEEATRTVSSDVPSDLVIQINNTTYHLHKFPLLPKCGLLQRLCAVLDESGSEGPVEVHDIPGGEEAFELCAKFCYGITINLSAQNFVPAFCAAKFLRMTESVEKGNFVLKLEAFFSSCILEGWKDTVITLQTTAKLTEWSENLGIIRQCVDSIVEKVLTHPSKITWSYTYTRPGYAQKRHNSVPKDWWTEDISDLNIDLFRCVITAIRSLNMVPSPLIGEALHVYACRWLPDTLKGRPPESSESQAEEDREKQRRVLELIVSMIPTDRGTVSTGFLLRLLSVANFIGASHSTKTELIRRSGWQLEEATVDDLLIPSCSPLNQHFHDIDLVQAVLDGFLSQWRRQTVMEDSEARKSIRKVAKLIDSYLQVVAKDINMPASKIIILAESLPEIARPQHDDIYKAINNYLKGHQDLSKVEKKRLCRILDCRKLSQEVCAHAVKNERLPLRTVVQVLFFDQERRAKTTNHKLPTPTEIFLERGHPKSVTRGEDRSRPVRASEGRQSSGAEHVATSTTSVPLDERVRRKPDGGRTKSDGARPKHDEMRTIEQERKMVRRVKDMEITEEGVSGIKLESKKVFVKKIKEAGGGPS